MAELSGSGFYSTFPAGANKKRASFKDILVDVLPMLRRSDLFSSDMIMFENQQSHEAGVFISICWFNPFLDNMIPIIQTRAASLLMLLCSAIDGRIDRSEAMIGREGRN